MKFNELWLREWVDPQLGTEALAAQLTMAGLEVDAIAPVAGFFSGVVVGEIVAVAPHPDADKLRVCQVAGAADTMQVVCGAANARVGLKVPFATLGALLPGDLKIKQAKLRGVESFGMLCAAAELGLAEQSDGLLELPADAPVGADIRSYLQLDDRVIEVGLTPNRADCLSIAGVAREVGVLNNIAVQAVAVDPVAATNDAVFPVEIIAGEDCPRYAGRVISGVDLTRPAPEWLRERLRRCGIRSIDPVVDVTNYVMLELGQPMHAFDLERLQGGIRVRKAKQGETLETLDGQQLTLRADSLVIADHRGPLALAGVMGGRPSAVSAETKHIFLESAFFAPGQIAGKARSYGLHTESSHRFERGVDYALQIKAIERATQLILASVGGEPGPVSDTSSASLPAPTAIALRRSSIARLLGVEIADERVEQILRGLGLAVTASSDGWSVLPPSWRFDIAIEVDLIEELARVHGYDHLPVRSIRADLPLAAKPERQLNLAALRRVLTARGYQEAITYSFVDPKLQALLAPQQPVVELRNPISADMSVMRTTLWAGLLNTLSYNLNRQQQRVRLFETGLRFLPAAEGLPQQEKMLAMVATGRRYPESWGASSEPVDFYDLKGDLEALFALARVPAEVTYRAGSHPALHPGQSADILRGGQVFGHLGALHPELQRQLGIDQPVYVVEIALANVLEGELPKFSELSRFPEVRRDLALLVDRDLAAETVLATAREAAGSYLRNLTLFDVYQGKGIDPQRKSLALGLTFQHSSRTLTEDEVNTTVEAVVGTLKERLAATLRN
ncbi:MAG TPA: phenylalanine--tRNA ligase subunit beta [Spongiibacteraceae bacterium]|nr:phenylalanine--tRNA ligase subunit beta [Spongiibacteraceae bacterium]